MVRKLKRVWWYDITSQTNEEIKKPYKQFLAKRWTIGYVHRDKDCVIVEYSNDDDKSASFDAIPKSVVIKIEDL